jgi:hypothetical protein
MSLNNKDKRTIEVAFANKDTAEKVVVMLESSGSGGGVESGSTSLAFNQGLGSLNCQHRKVGDIVTLQIPNMIGTANANAEIISSNALPASLRPSFPATFPVVISIDGGSSFIIGAIYVDNLGVVSIYSDAATWSGLTSGQSFIVYQTIVTWIAGA